MLVPAALALSGCGKKDTEKPKPRPRVPFQQRLANQKAGWEAKAPEEQKKIFEDAIAALAKSTIVKMARKVGDKAPAFELVTGDGSEVTLAGLLKTGPVVVVWYRGGWCPYCNIHLSGLQEVLPEIRSLGATLVAISPEQPKYAEATVRKSDLRFQVLSDLGNIAARRYGLVYTVDDKVLEQFKGRIDIHEFNGDPSNELPLAATYVIDAKGVIRYAFVDPDYRKRADPADVLAALRKLKEPPAPKPPARPAKDTARKNKKR